MSLSLSDSSLDLLAHFDVLEHVPDLRLGLAEAYRVLRPGGAMLFTVPFYPDLEENIVCAQLGSDGGIVHFRPPSYHGNPVSSEGALVFTVPGWSLLTDVKAAGFCLKTSLAVDPAGGILSNGCPFPDGRSWALTFLASKPG